MGCDMVLMSEESLHDPLLPTSSAYVREDSKSGPVHPWRNWVLAVSLILNILVLGYARSSRTCQMPEIYSPANHVVEYVERRFNDVWDRSIYYGDPSPALDDAWKALYMYGIMQLPESEAALLPNKTARIPGDEGNYIFMVDVFHQLHCLNMVRQALHKEYYDDAYFAKMVIDNPLKIQVEGHEDFDHVDHCIETIRESLMCSADITPIVWVWDDKLNRTSFRLDVVHVCRDFNKIQEWAYPHRLQTPFDTGVNLEDT